MSVRLAPDLYPYGDELPNVEDLAPEEVRYLCDLCRLLARLGACTGLRSGKERQVVDESTFDADELGIDPEEECQD